MGAHCPRFLLLILPVLGLALLVAAPADLRAAEPRDADQDADQNAKVIVIEHGEEELVIDMAEVQAVVDEAMAGLDEALAEIQDMQLEVRLGKDNHLNLSYDETTFELDLDQIMTQISAAVQVGFDQFDTADWAQARDRWSEVSEDDLKQELEDLKREMKDLRRELRQIKEAEGH
jgi:hypothetical protein